MRRIVFVLVAFGVLTGVVAYVAPASGQADGEGAPNFRGNTPLGTFFLPRDRQSARLCLRPLRA
jgi:hypothetical protein